MSELKQSAGRILSFFSMLDAHYELAEGKPVDDDTIVLSFVGSGASDNLTMGDFRKLRDAYNAES